MLPMDDVLNPAQFSRQLFDYSLRWVGRVDGISEGVRRRWNALGPNGEPVLNFGYQTLELWVRH